ncbi:MAG: NAD+ synthase [Candidatus Hydrothermarchaeales archaeon]
MNKKIAIAQTNPTVGDLEGNIDKIISYIERAKKQGAEVVVFPELAITGYPPKDLLLKPSFVKQNKERLKEIVKNSEGIDIIVGFVDEEKGELYNAAAVVSDGDLIGVQHKICLPNYDVFDEKRYFQPGAESHIFELSAMKLGVNICEDIWVDDGPTERQAKKGAEVIVNISASPFHAGKIRDKEELLARRARENGVMVVYNNLVGGQDDLVFDGRSCIFNKKGEIIAQSKAFEEDLSICDLSNPCKTVVERDPIEETYHALVLGIRDYVRKNGFKKVVIGLSGGIDSALATALAVEALDTKSVVVVSMPSRISSKGSREDAKRMAENLGVELKIIPISEGVEAYSKMLSDEFEGTKSDVTEENIQARIRGNILMSLSNKFGYLVLTTGNKSELAVGYTTLYGDMAGGLAAISDVPKSTVYKLATYINSLKRREVIPQTIIEKEPSAELREGQKDSDTLPPYDVLDQILSAYIEENKSKEEIIGQGFDEEIVSDVIWRVDHNEYKRQQAALGIRITPKAFGSGRRMPITNKYKG